MSGIFSRCADIDIKVQQTQKLDIGVFSAVAAGAGDGAYPLVWRLVKQVRRPGLNADICALYIRLGHVAEPDKVGLVIDIRDPQAGGKEPKLGYPQPRMRQQPIVHDTRVK